MTTIPDDIASFTIPYEYRPGTDLITKIILKEEDVMNMIIEELVGPRAVGHYTLGRCEWTNKTISDIFYLSSDKEYPPILIEIQDKVNPEFITRACGYCVSLFQQYDTNVEKERLLQLKTYLICHWTPRPLPRSSLKDLAVIKNHYNNLTEPMRWKPLYDSGVKQGYFSTFEDSTELKDAYHNYKRAMKKHGGN